MDFNKLVHKDEIEIYRNVNDIDIDLSDESNLDILINVIKSNRILQCLYLRSNKIDQQGAKRLSNVFKVSKTLEIIDLDDNNIGHQGAKHLADAIAKNTTIRRLSLYRNNIGDTGARYLANALKSNNTLRRITLSGNNISDEGMKHLADALKENNTLQELDLWNNKIGDNGAKFLANALKENNTLETIVLDNNYIGYGFVSIADSLLVNTGLRKLSLNHNEIEEEGGERVARNLQSNHSIKSLVLGGDIIDIVTRRKIRTILDDPKRDYIVRLRNIISSKDKEIASLKESLKNSKPIDVVDLTDNSFHLNVLEWKMLVPLKAA